MADIFGAPVSKAWCDAYRIFGCAAPECNLELASVYKYCMYVPQSGIESEAEVAQGAEVLDEGGPSFDKDHRRSAAGDIGIPTPVPSTDPVMECTQTVGLGGSDGAVGTGFGMASAITGKPPRDPTPSSRALYGMRPSKPIGKQDVNHGKYGKGKWGPGKNDTY